jgi:hypothetical protein
MDWDEAEGNESLAGGILKAVGTGMTLAFVGLTAKVLLSGTAVPVDEMMTIAFAGVAGTTCLVGGVAAERERISLERDEDEGAVCCQAARGPCVAVTPQVASVAESEISAGRERGFVARLEQERTARGGREAETASIV